MIQPFDKGKFDRRYQETFKPAIEKAGFEADRVDEDPSVTIVIDRIEKGINGASVCLAEITMDNANVWFEVGYALACRKPVVMICEKDARTAFPFDVRHRSILEYDIGSRSDFGQLESKIVERLKAIDKTQVVVGQLPPEGAATNPAMFEGLSRHEVIVLTVVAENSIGTRFESVSNGLSADDMTEDMVSEIQILKGTAQNALHQAKAVLGLRQLVRKGILNIATLTLSTGSGVFYQITNFGWTCFSKIADNLPLKPTTERPKALRVR